MQGYNKKGLYNAYDKKHKERDALDYYSTPVQEVTNILNELKLNLNNQVVLEPCCGGGHMYKGIENYNQNCKIIATDVTERQSNIIFPHYAGLEYDFLADNYIIPEDYEIDYVIMNPPYSTIEPFVIRALEIATKGVLMLGRLQFLEGQARYKNILEKNPPTDVYIYVDRIQCYKGGNTSITGSSAQAYAWFYWDLKKDNPRTELHWIRRV